MKCKKHCAEDPSSVDGVCATCLRERLLVVMEAQTQADLVANIAGKICRRSSDTSSPVQIEFPRSVSPYINCRNIENAVVRSNHGHTLSDQRFYSTPQVLYRKKQTKFSIVSYFFRSKASDLDSDLKPRESCVTTANPLPWWISSMLPIKQKKKKKSCIFTLTDPNASRVMQRPCRGMSPADESDGDCNSPVTSPQLKETPSRTAAPVQFRSKQMNQATNITGFAFCLSPLVRPSPKRNWNQKGVAPEISIAGDTRIPVKPHIGNASAFYANRSKKLANCGKFHQKY